MENEYLGYEKEAEIFSKLSGTKPSGEKAATVIYQFYNEEDTDRKKAAFLLETAESSVRSDPAHMGTIVMELNFASCNDPALSLLVRNLCAFDEGVTKNPEKKWVFYFNVTRMDELSDDKAYTLTLHAANPVLWCLSRKSPTQLSAETEIDGTLYGGNVVKLVFSANSIEVEESDEKDVGTARAEILRELDAETFS